MVTLTNTLSHLTCHYSLNPPQRHRTSRILRGENLPWGAYWCFTAWQDLEQQEPGDTLYHTFIFPSWPPDQTRWFTFTATIASQPSPSAGPIIKHTHPGADNLDIILRPSSPGDLCHPDIDGTGLPCPLHYRTVDSPPPFGDFTYLEPATYDNVWKDDSYNLPSINPGTIEYITHTYRFKTLGTYPPAYVTGHLLRIAGTNYTMYRMGSPADWFTISTNYAVNPHTHLPWTTADINALQAGITIRAGRQALWLIIGQCSEVYITVRRLLNYPPEPPLPWPE